MYALANRFPRLLTGLPRCSLSALPTPVDQAANLGADLGLSELLIKRDDLTAPLYGGNKVRKLEYLLADAQCRDCDTVITFGAVGSNHALATAIYAKQLGMHCIVVLIDQPPTPNIASTLRYHARLGTQLVHAKGYSESLGLCEEITNAHPRGPQFVYQIPWGGSSWLGTVGFVNAAFELREQLGAKIPDVIYTACGTMGTAIGLALGLRLAGLQTRVEAVQVVPKVVTNPDRFRSIYLEASEQLQRLDSSVPAIADPERNVNIRTDAFGSGYAETTPECLDAVRRIADTERLQLDTTYTGKALAALIADAQADVLDGQRVMFWNTYNSRPLPEDIDDVPTDSIPVSLHGYFKVS